MVEACNDYCMQSATVLDLKEEVKDIRCDVDALKQVSAARTVENANFKKDLNRISTQNWAIIAMFIATLLGIWLKK